MIKMYYSVGILVYSSELYNSVWSCAELESSGDIGRGGGGGSPGGAERGGDKQGRVVQMALMGPGGTV